MIGTRVCFEYYLYRTHSVLSVIHVLLWGWFAPNNESKWKQQYVQLYESAFLLINNNITFKYIVVVCVTGALYSLLLLQ